MSARRLLATLLLLLSLAAVPHAQDEAFSLGVEAYRRGNYGEAQAYWRECLALPLAPESRARVAYNLGNAAWRAEEQFHAVGWYTLALEDAPRDSDIWHNLELARSSAGLEPADRGDLSDTLDRLSSSFRPEEARRLAQLGLALLLLALIGEALRGGVLWKRLSLVALVLCALLAVPWLRDLGSGGGASERMLIVRSPTVALRSEPRLELRAIESVAGGDEVIGIDALPGWVRVRTADGKRGWLQDSAVFRLSASARGGARPAARGDA